MSKRIFLYVILANACLLTASAQEIVMGLQSNPGILKEHMKYRFTKDLVPPDTLNLPFFDDFSGRSIFPEQKNWTDNYVFINNTYSEQQITIGIASFDAIDNTGKMYSTAASSGFKADQLTSKPLNLNYTSSDNVFLSFFYEPGGLSDPPEKNDSLTLQFFAPSEQKWYSVWKAEGSQDIRFKPAIIRIDNDRFLKKGFQFRFVNYATLSSDLSDPSMVGNCDLWNIDYVVLNKNRNPADTVFADVAYTLPIRSMLKSNEAMPWKQFRQVYLQEMGAFLPVHYRNNDLITRNITRNFEIRDVYRNIVVHAFSAGATIISPLTSVDYNASLIYTFNSIYNDSALFRITASLKTDIFDPKANDTMVYYQVFKNYFAFDDGTSEGGYGVNGLGSRNAMVAYRFITATQDTLRAIRICFNDSYLDANKKTFDLMVWDNDNGIPGNMLYTMEGVSVAQGDALNGFFEYIIPEGVLLNGTFYIGWKQRTESFLNVGYDINTPNSGRQFYWLNGEWRQSQVPGSIMLRPVVGSHLLITSINETPDKKLRLKKIWPNPAKDYINIDPGDLKIYGTSYIIINDLNGREVLKVPYAERVDIASLHEGIYILVISVDGKPVEYNRLIKIR